MLRRMVLLLLVPARAAAVAAGKASVLLLLLLLELRGLDRGQRQRGLHGRRRAILPYPAVIVFRAWRRSGRARVIGREREDDESHRKREMPDKRTQEQPRGPWTRLP